MSHLLRHLPLQCVLHQHGSQHIGRGDPDGAHPRPAPESFRRHVAKRSGAAETHLVDSVRGGEQDMYETRTTLVGADLPGSVQLAGR